MKNIPFPDNPHHVENLKSIDLLKEQNFEGCDASLVISLHEYGLAWREIGEEILFVYSIGNNRFDRCTMRKNLDRRKEFNWIEDWGEICNFLGMKRQSFFEYPLENFISDLVQYYGFENIFGSSYWEGFEIEGVKE